MINLNILTNNESTGDFALHQNKKTGKIDIITYEIDHAPVLILKKDGKWNTVKDLKLFSYGKKIGNKKLEVILKRARNAEDIRMVSSPASTSINKFSF